MTDDAKPPEPKPKKPSLDPMLRRWGIRIPYLKITYTHPTPEEIRKLRIDAGLTQEQAAKATGLGKGGNVRWSEYEAGVAHPDVTRWALFQLIVRSHPEWRLKRNKHGI